MHFQDLRNRLEFDEVSLLEWHENLEVFEIRTVKQDKNDPWAYFKGVDNVTNDVTDDTTDF